jgi:tetratricopeptide (TPR) repeat protein
LTLLGQLNTLESTGLLRIAQVEPDLEYLFRHTLVREAAYSSLLSADQKRLHLIVGEVIERLYPDRLDEFASTLAHHFGVAGDDRKSVKYCSLAGDAALASYANHEAENHLRCALGGAQSETEQADILSKLGEALYRQSRFTEAITTWRKGIELYQVLGDLDKTALLFSRAARAAWHNGDHPEGLRLCQQGLSLVESLSESSYKAQLIHEAARAYHFNGFPAQAEPLCRQAISIAERHGAIAVKADALTTLGILPNITAEEALGSLAQAVELAETHGLLDIATRAHHNYGVVTAQHLSDQVAARDQYQRAAECARLRGATQEELFSLVVAAGASLTLGELKTADALVSSIEQLSKTLLNPDQVKLEVESIKFGIYLLQGNLQQTLELLDDLQVEARKRGDLQQLYNFCNNTANAYIIMDRVEGVDDWSKAEHASLEAVEISNRGVGDQVDSRCILGLILVRQGRLAEARQLLEEAHQKAISPSIVWQEQALLNLERDLAGAEARWEQALAAAESVCNLFAQIGARWPWAYSLYEWAEVHLARAEPVDFERGRALYREALTLFRDMGADFYADLLEERLPALRAKTYAATIAHEKITQELVEAGRIQASLLPEQIPVLPGWEISAILQPARETSGDFYDLIHLSDNQLGIVVADVADKGMGAALYMAACRTLIRTFAVEHPDKPEAVLEQANRRMLADTHGGLFITVFYGVLETNTGRLLYCNAGHNPPYHVRSSDPDQPHTLTRTGMPLGVLEETTWEQASVTLESADVLVVYTDGLTEAQSEQQEFYNEPRLVSAIQSNLAQSASLLQQALISDVNGFIGKAPKMDDLTLMVIRRC